MATSTSRVLASAVAVLLAAGLPIGTVAAAEAPEQVGSSGPHPKPPTGRELERLVALNDHEPHIEGGGDIAAAVVTHSVYVKVAADEEWRSWYGANAFAVATDAIEAADDATYAEFGINLIKHSTVNWTSNPGSSPNACDLRNDLDADFNPSPADIVLGFSKNYSVDFAGCAAGNVAEVNWNQSSYNMWVTTQHEVSHIFGAPDRKSTLLNHPVDVMENQYQAPDFWCTTSGYNDWGLISFNAAKFD